MLILRSASRTDSETVNEKVEAVMDYIDSVVAKDLKKWNKKQGE